MIEPIMYIGIGFLVASLLVIGVIPLVHARAVRLTAKRLEALTPMSMAEIQAEKDQLRAEFAMTTRRLEMSVEQMKAKTTNQLAEIGKKSEAVGRLKLELGEKSAAMFALEAKENQLAEDLRQTQKDLAARTAALQQAEQSLAGARAKIGELNLNVNDITLTGDEQRVELIALRAQVEVLKGQAETLESEVKELTERLNMKTSEADGYNRQLVDERGRSDALSNRIGELERQLVAQTTEAEILERRVHELNARADEQGRLLAERDYATDRLRDEAVSTTQIGTAVRAELAEAESRSRAATEILRTEKILLESQLRQAQEERAQLQYDLEIIRHEVEFGEKSAAMFALEAKEKQLAEDLRQTQKDLAARTAALQQAEQSLAGARAKIGELTSNVNDITLTSDKQRVELIALRAQVEVFKGQAETLENEVKELTERLNLKTSEADGYNRQLVDERRRGDAHSNRIGELERQLVAQTTEAGVLERRLQELNARADEQGRLLVERDYVIDRLRNDAASGNQVETAVRAELAEAESRSRAATEILRTEKSLLESQLQQAQEERGQLQHDLETIRREVETWAAERTENAVMRERITDVAAEVARLTSLVEGPGNAIEQILAGDDARANGNGGNGEIKKGSLADRIRALQTRARTPQPTDV